MLDELADQLHASQRVYIEAPAGHGKTFLILHTISRYPYSRQLILTHTVAGVAALRTKMQDLGLSEDSVAINTIAGWAQKYVRGYPSLAGIDLEELDKLEPKYYWPQIYTSFNKLLKKKHIVDIIKTNYEGVYIDEYQDCSAAQHSIALQLCDILPVRVLGDPLQGIFDFNKDMVDWNDVETSYTHLATLETPYRWLNADNEEYATWLSKIRDDLKSNYSINLNEVPSCVNIIPLTGQTVADSISCVNEARTTLPRGHRRLIIGDKYNLMSKNLVKNLSRPRYTLIESLDSAEVRSLREYAQTIDTQYKDPDLELMKIIANCYTGLSKLNTKVKRIRDDPAYTPNVPILLAVKNLKDTFDPEEALKIIKAAEAFTPHGCHRRQMIIILEMSLANFIAKSYESFTESMIAAIESIRQKGRKLPFYSIGSTLLVKGLEVEEVILLDAQELGKRDFYVALTRPTKKITIFTSEMTLTPK